MSSKSLYLACCVLALAVPSPAQAQQEALTPLMKSAVQTVLGQVPGSQCTTPQPKSFPGEMKYYHTFHPSDSFYETWCKIQMFKTNGQTDVVVALSTEEHQQDLATWRDGSGLNGQPTGTNEWFATEWVRQISRFANSLDVAAYFWRATKQAKDVGVPADSPQAGYLFYNGHLVLTMKNLDIMGVKFVVQATLVPDLGLVQKRLAEGKPSYLEFEMFSPEDRRKLAGGAPSGLDQARARMMGMKKRTGERSVSADPATPRASEPQPGMGRVVGFPMRLGMVTIYSDEPAIRNAGPEIRKAFLSKYVKFVGPAEKDPADPKQTVTRFTDKFVMAFLHEGVAENGRNYIQVNYVPAQGSSLDITAAGVKSFKAYAAGLAESERQAGAEKARQKKGENTDF